MALTSDSCMLNSKDWLGRDQAGIHHSPWVAGKALRQIGRGKIAGVNTTNHWAWSNITATLSAAPWEYSFPLLDVPCFHSIIRGISCLKSHLLPGIKELVLLPTVPTEIWALYVCNLPVIENGNSCSNRYKDWIQQTSYFSGFCLFLKKYVFWIRCFFLNGFPFAALLRTSRNTLGFVISSLVTTRLNMMIVGCIGQQETDPRIRKICSALS